MKLKKNIFDRLSLKKKINLNKQNQVSEHLASQSEKNSRLIEQIKQLQTQRETDDTAVQSGYFLKSQNWYSQKLMKKEKKKLLCFKLKKNSSPLK